VSSDLAGGCKSVFTSSTASLCAAVRYNPTPKSRKSNFNQILDNSSHVFVTSICSSSHDVLDECIRKENVNSGIRKDMYLWTTTAYVQNAACIISVALVFLVGTFDTLYYTPPYPNFHFLTLILSITRNVRAFATSLSSDFKLVPQFPLFLRLYSCCQSPSEYE